jgi:hypothetical protein
MVTRMIRQLCWAACETPKGRLGNFSIDSALLKVPNGDPSASMREIAQDTKLSVSTVFQVVMTRVGHIY